MLRGAKQDGALNAARADDVNSCLPRICHMPPSSVLSSEHTWYIYRSRQRNSRASSRVRSSSACRFSPMSTSLLYNTLSPGTNEEIISENIIWKNNQRAELISKWVSMVKFQKLARSRYPLFNFSKKNKC